MDTKKCNVCRKTKPHTEFYKLKSSSDNLSHHCKVCHKEMNDRWRSTDSGKQTQRKTVDKYQQTLTGKETAQRAASKYNKSKQGKEVHLIAQHKYLQDDANYEKHIARNYQYAQTEQGKLASHRARISEKGKVRNRKNSQNRRARKLDATPMWFTEFDDLVLYELSEKAQLMEQLTGNEYHIDHIIPLQGDHVCGLHIHNNWQLLTSVENKQKNNLLLEEYI